MSQPQFVHLHVHTQYSLLDGAIRVEELMKRCADLGMPAVGMTDHGAMYGAVHFQKAAKGAGIKPIIGVDLYVADGPRTTESRKAHHLTLLARNLQGYRNLSTIVSMAWLEGKHPQTGIPRADLELLRDHAEGIICLTGDLAGEVNQWLLRGKMEQAEEAVGRLEAIFGRENLFLEVIDGPLAEFKKCREGMVELSKRTGLPLVATNDCHYLKQDDALAHAILMCIQLGKSVDPEQVLAHGLDTLYLKSAEEMWESFADIPEACENTLRIAEMIDLTIPLGQVFLPLYDVPQEFRQERGLTEDVRLAIHEYFAQVARDGLITRFEEFAEVGLEVDRPLYQERLDEEIRIIQQMDFPGYFLIVWDFINYAKSIGVPVGPGRGSGAGSLVAYAMAITDIDPIPYGLLFERFLNPERVSMPDFDIDFCMNRRGEVIDYVTKKYGEMNVGQIITYGQLKARACIKDVGRALGLNYNDTDRIAKLVPEEINISLQAALDREPKLREACAEDARIQTLFDIALRLENLNRQAGMHAAGIVISEDPLWHTVPVCRGANDELVTQYAKNEVEEAGLVKFDFLGLKTLTVIDTAVRLINVERARAGQPKFNIRAIPMDDRGVFNTISKGNTTGIFQLESSGFQSLLQKLKPDVFEDIVAAVALYRPGPLGTGMVDDFIDCKHGRKAIEYPHPWLEDVLRETYGTIVYQEQVMKIAQVMAGYSLGGADLLRRAMGKKKASVMDQQRAVFVKGSTERGIEEKKANDVFDLMAYFAGYGFNKSHSAAYALITYQTAYLKEHYPVEFMAALMTCDRENTDKVVRFINEAKGMGIQVLPPDVNESGLDFSVVDRKIRFGLGAIKGVGESAIESVLEARQAKGAFKSLYDFCERVDLKRVNKRVLEAMIRAGAFDSVGLASDRMGNMLALCASRARMFEAIPTAMDRGQKAQQDRNSGQVNLFGMFAAVSTRPTEDFYPEVEAWTDKELLAQEKASVGFFVSGHPLDRYEEEVQRYAPYDTRKLKGLRNRDEVTLAGVITSLREKSLKSGTGRMAFIEFEDREGQIEIICFARNYAEAEDTLKSDEPLLIKGQVSIEGESGNLTYKLRMSEAMRLVDARKAKVKRVQIEVEADEIGHKRMAKLAEVLKTHPGECTTELRLRIQTHEASGTSILTLGHEFKVDPTDDLLIAVERLFGRRVVSLR